MPRKRHHPEEIVAKLRQVDVLTSQGQSVADAVRSIGVQRARELPRWVFSLSTSKRNYAELQREIYAMKKLAIAFAGLAAIGFSGAAFADEATTGSPTITTGPAAMTDSEMDGVTAAGGPPPFPGFGTITAGQVNGKGGVWDTTVGEGKLSAPGQQP